MPDGRSAFREFERSGWERAAARYAECWTDTVPLVPALLGPAGVGAGTLRWLPAGASSLDLRRTVVLRQAVTN